jgi:pentatricopeptide repeat protein
MEADGIETNIVMLNSILNSFSVAAKPEEGLAVFEYMHQNVSPLVSVPYSLQYWPKKTLIYLSFFFL